MGRDVLCDAMAADDRWPFLRRPKGAKVCSSSAPTRTPSPEPEASSPASGSETPGARWATATVTVKNTFLDVVGDVPPCLPPRSRSCDAVLSGGLGIQDASEEESAPGDSEPEAVQCPTPVHADEPALWWPAPAANCMVWGPMVGACPEAAAEAAACGFQVLACPVPLELLGWALPVDAVGAAEPDEAHTSPAKLRRIRRRGAHQRSTALPATAGTGHAASADAMTQLHASEQPCAAAGLRGAFARLAFDTEGCRVAQAALDAAEQEERLQLVSELHGYVRLALESPSANFVVQKVVEVTPAAQVAFVIEELMGVAVKTAMHRFGCRVLCRLLEHCTRAQLEPLVAELLAEASSLCRHSFGNHVIRHILEHGTEEHRKRIAQTLLKDVLGFSSHRTASCVVEQALTYCAAEERRAFLRVLLRSVDCFVRLAQGRYGSYVAKALLSLPGEQGEESRALLAQAQPQLQGSKYGKRVLARNGDGDDVASA